MKISDELREWASHAMVNKHADVHELPAIADRIDRETVELPKDADGAPIRVGDIVWGCISGMEMTISELRLTDTGRWVVTTTRGLTPVSAKVTHVCPDSWERIRRQAKKEDKR